MATSRNHPKTDLASAIVLVLASCTTLWAVEFAGGTGEPNDPYQIATAEQLISIGQDPDLLDKHFVLVNDIDLDPNLPGGRVFEGAVIPEWSGVFDGGGFRVSHLTIKASSEGPRAAVGLFGGVGPTGEVRCLVLEDVDISGGWYGINIGAVCGGNSGVVSRCAVSGTIAVSSSAGGVVAANYGVVEECSFLGTVSGSDSAGLVGVNKGRVERCFAAGRVSSGYTAGGLVWCHFIGSIEQCYAACEVHGTDGCSGGLVGTISTDRSRGVTVTECYFLPSNEGGGPDNGIGAPLSSAQMKQASSFVGWEFWDFASADSEATWFMPADGYPRLVWLVQETISNASGQPVRAARRRIAGAGIELSSVGYDFDPAIAYGHVIVARTRPGVRLDMDTDLLVSLGPYDWTTNPGAGTADDPYLILTLGQQDCLAYQPELWDRYFRLIDDLSDTGRVEDLTLEAAERWYNGAGVGAVQRKEK